LQAGVNVAARRDRTDPAGVRGPDFRQVAEDYYRSIAGSEPSVVKRVIAEARAAPQATLVGCFEALRDFEPRLLAEQYSGPMLSIIRPRNDTTGALHRIRPGWPHQSIPWTGHWIHLDSADSFLRHAQAFVDRVAGGEASR
jgi:pimeloyl-ACP methyl ester carboxylesterase